LYKNNILVSRPIEETKPNQNKSSTPATPSKKAAVKSQEKLVILKFKNKQTNKQTNTNKHTQTHKHTHTHTYTGIEYWIEWICIGG